MITPALENPTRADLYFQSTLATWILRKLFKGIEILTCRWRNLLHLRFLWLLGWIFRKFEMSSAWCLTRIMLPVLSIIEFSNYGYQNDQTLATKMTSKDVDHKQQHQKPHLEIPTQNFGRRKIKNSCCRQLDQPIKTPYGNLFWSFV
jgi:hypothetical protein